LPSPFFDPWATALRSKPVVVLELQNEIQNLLMEVTLRHHDEMIVS
jgi:hypothetical protein